MSSTPALTFKNWSEEATGRWPRAQTDLPRNVVSSDAEQRLLGEALEPQPRARLQPEILRGPGGPSQTPGGCCSSACSWLSLYLNLDWDGGGKNKKTKKCLKFSELHCTWGSALGAFSELGLRMRRVGGSGVESQPAGGWLSSWRLRSACNAPRRRPAPSLYSGF